MRITVFVLLLIINLNLSAKQYLVTSPNGKTEVSVTVDEVVKWSASYLETALFSNNEINLQLANKTLGEKPRVISAKTKSFAFEEISVVPVKSKMVKSEYNELYLKIRGDYSIVFRVYNEGIAYRFETRFKDEITVVNEKADINLASDFSVLFPEEDKLISHYERLYVDEKASEIGKGRFCSLPALLKAENNIKIGITEADLYDYPCLFLNAEEGISFSSKFPEVVLEAEATQRGADRNQIIKKEADYIAKTSGKRTFPWRVFMLSENDAELLENQMVYSLSRPTTLENTAWIKPGQVAWDWWNDNNIYGVDFESGLNTETYKYYIDFAAKFGLEYIILDEGWSLTTTNLLKPNNNLDLEELISYAESKNVGVILWLLWGPLDRDMETILDQFKAWGAKGIKVDFMQRADQEMVNFYEKAARECAKRELLVDYHGAFKPAGLRKAYPNIVNYEGLKGMENNKWSDVITPKHDVTLPFTRMLAGPMDFTPGSMLNAQNRDYDVSWSNPMSMGTRAHQVAMYVIYEAPLQMLSDNPSNLYKEAETVEFISRIPTVWDETVGLDGKVGEYVAVARKKDNVWYIGAMTNWDERELEIDLLFLDEGEYEIEIFRDGVNANKSARDYKLLTQEVNKSDKLNVKLAKGGGWTAICKKK